MTELLYCNSEISRLTAKIQETEKELQDLNAKLQNIKKDKVTVLRGMYPHIFCLILVPNTRNQITKTIGYFTTLEDAKKGHLLDFYDKITGTTWRSEIRVMDSAKISDENILKIDLKTSD
jgi:hypothetical protein